MTDYDHRGEKPLPAVDPDSEAYWEAASNEEFVVQHCEVCHEHQFYPRSVCRNCWSTDLSMDDVSGDGTVYSYTICHVSGQQGYDDETPYNFALVEIDLPSENPSGAPVRIPTHVVDIAHEDLEVGLPVRVTFEQVSTDPDVRLPVFAPKTA